MSAAAGLRFIPIESLDALQLLELRADALASRDHQLAQRCLLRLRQLARPPDREHVIQRALNLVRGLDVVAAEDPSGERLNRSQAMLGVLGSQSR